MECAFCGGKLNIKEKVSRSDTCPGCGGDLRCCKHCNFYDPQAYNECKEVMAEMVADKERANFCDYFILNGSTRKKVNRTRDARDALEALFKK